MGGLTTGPEGHAGGRWTVRTPGSWRAGRWLRPPPPQLCGPSAGQASWCVVSCDQVAGPPHCPGATSPRVARPPRASLLWRAMWRGASRAEPLSRGLCQMHGHPDSSTTSHPHGKVKTCFPHESRAHAWASVHVRHGPPIPPRRPGTQEPAALPCRVPAPRQGSALSPTAQGSPT